MGVTNPGFGIRGISAGATLATNGTVVFSNSNGVSFGLNGSTVTATVATNYLTTAMASNRGSDFVQANAAFAGTSASGTIASNGISVSVGPYITTAMLSNAVTLSNIRVSAGTASNNLSALTFDNAGGVSFGLNGSVITAEAPAGVPSPVNFSAGTTSNNLASVIFANGNGVSFGLNTGASSQSITASHNGITTGRASNDGVGLATAQTNVTWTVNSAGLSLNASGYAGTGFTSTTTAGTEIKATQNTAGLSMAVPVYLTAAAGGAGLIGGMTNIGNTSGTSGVVSSQIVFAGGNNITLSQSVNGQSATLTISAAAGGGGGYSLFSAENFPKVMTANVSNMTLTILTQRPIFIPFELGGSLTHNIMQIEVSRATSGSNAFTMQAALYSMANTTQLSRIASLQNVFSNTATASISGIRRIQLTGFETAGSTLSPGQYVMMLYASAAATASMNYSYRGGVTVAPDVGLIGAGSNQVTTATSAMSMGGFRAFHGLYTTTTASPPSTVGYTQISQHTRGVPIWFWLGRT